MEDWVIIWHSILFEDEIGHPMKSSRGRLIFFEGWGVQDKNSPHGTHPEYLGRGCSERDNDESLYKSLVSPALSSDLVER